MTTWSTRLQVSIWMRWNQWPSYDNSKRWQDSLWCHPWWGATTTCNWYNDTSYRGVRGTIPLPRGDLSHGHMLSPLMVNWCIQGYILWRYCNNENILWDNEKVVGTCRCIDQGCWGLGPPSLTSTTWSFTTFFCFLTLHDFKCQNTIMSLPWPRTQCPAFNINFLALPSFQRNSPSLWKLLRLLMFMC